MLVTKPTSSTKQTLEIPSPSLLKTPSSESKAHSSRGSASSTNGSSRPGFDFAALTAALSRMSSRSSRKGSLAASSEEEPSLPALPEELQETQLLSSQAVRVPEIIQGPPIFKHPFQQGIDYLRELLNALDLEQEQWLPVFDQIPDFCVLKVKLYKRTLSDDELEAALAPIQEKLTKLFNPIIHEVLEVANRLRFQPVSPATSLKIFAALSIAADKLRRISIDVTCPDDYELIAEDLWKKLISLRDQQSTHFSRTYRQAHLSKRDMQFDASSVGDAVTVLTTLGEVNPMYKATLMRILVNAFPVAALLQEGVRRQAVDQHDCYDWRAVSQSAIRYLIGVAQKQVAPTDQDAVRATIKAFTGFVAKQHGYQQESKQGGRLISTKTGAPVSSPANAPKLPSVVPVLRQANGVVFSQSPAKSAASSRKPSAPKSRFFSLDVSGGTPVSAQAQGPSKTVPNKQQGGITSQFG